MCLPIRAMQNVINSDASKVWPDRTTTATITSSSVSSLGTPNAAASSTAGVQLDDFFDFERRDVLASPADAVGAAADEVEEAIGIAAGEVSGVEPQVASRLQRSRGHAVVAIRHQRRFVGANDDLADVVDCNLEAHFVEQAHVVLRDRPPARTLPSGLVDRVIHRDAGVGRSVQLHQLHAEALLEVGGELGHGHAPAEPGGIVAVVDRTMAACAAWSAWRP